MKFDAVIPFCSYDEHFIDEAINGIRGLASNIYIIYCDKLFDGRDENIEVIQNVQSRNLDCMFYQQKFDKTNTSRWHSNNARWLGYQLSKSPNLLFLDSDEIFEKNKFSDWLEANKDNKDIIYFANYWYFRDKKYQALTYEDSPVLVTKEYLKYRDLFFVNMERGAYKLVAEASKRTMEMGLDGLPMCHHYSWVLSKEEMLKKVETWGHKNDRDWKSLIEEEFSRDFNGTDFVHGYKYRILDEAK